ncbi:MAG: hypothetical protein A3H97_03190 [Acidobacteria bacterium RIFCSPLOWO2_02_FULL_65_29]|nr:MAG: hypothetical protein A3H97_03190 [Acidobacteria bacterium RIFCSPLOWO2_02_FULL_65_29]
MKLLALVGLSIVIAGCSSGTPESSQPAASAPAAAPPAPTSRVFFVEPTDGATVKSPVLLRFGAESFSIMAVPAGEVTAVRAGMGHHHVGVDIDCLPPGTEIPKADPWVHFGTGGAEMAPGMQLTPGPHKLTLQIGDDKHMTIAGLCQTINVTVAQ